MICLKCKKEFSRIIIINGKKRNLSNRKYCFNCSPFGQHNTRILDNRKSKQRDLTAQNKICNKCKKEFISYQNRLVCGACHVAESRRRKKIKLIEYKGNKCQICGYNKCVWSLSFHHLNPDIKELTISQSGKGFEKMKKEVDKCILVCNNCHGEIHAGIIDLDNIKLKNY